MDFSGIRRALKGTSVGWVLFAIIGGGFGLYVADAFRQDRAALKAEAEKPKPVGCDKAWAEKVVRTAEASALVRGEDVTRDEGLVIVVRRGPWSALDLTAQKSLSAAYDCAVAGEGGHLKVMRFRHERAGSDLIMFDAVGLYELRQAGYGYPPAK